MKNLLGEIPYFKHLPQELIEKIERIAVFMQVPKGQLVFTKNSKATGFYILKEGKLKLFTTDPLSGKEQIVKIVEPVTLFGEAASFSGQNFPVNVEALEDSKIVYIDRNQLLKLAKTYPEICVNIAQTLAERLYHLVNLVEILTLTGAVPRLAKYILQHQKKGKIENFKTTEVASILGLTPEAVSRALNTLKTQGVIKKDKKTVTVLDERKLKILAGEI